MHLNFLANILRVPCGNGNVGVKSKRSGQNNNGKHLNGLTSAYESGVFIVIFITGA